LDRGDAYTKQNTANGVILSGIDVARILKANVKISDFRFDICVAQSRILRFYTGNESAPIQLAQCRFPGLAISSAKILIYFQIIYTEAILSNSTRKLYDYGLSLFGTAHRLRKKIIVSFVIIFGTLSFPMGAIEPSPVLFTVYCVSKRPRIYF